jgi:surface protein
MSTSFRELDPSQPEEEKREEDPTNEFSQPTYVTSGFSNDGLRNALNNYFLNQNSWGLPPIAEWKVHSVTDMSNLFSEFPRIIPEFGKKDLDLSKWDVGNVRTMNHMFNGCMYLKSDLSKWNVLNVTTMSHMFNECRYFESDLSLWKVQNVTSMDRMFWNCLKLFTNLRFWRLNPKIIATDPISFKEMVFGNEITMMGLSRHHSLLPTTYIPPPHPEFSPPPCTFEPPFPPSTPSRSLSLSPLPPRSPSLSQYISLSPVPPRSPSLSQSISLSPLPPGLSQVEENLFLRRYPDFIAFTNFLFHYLLKASPNEVDLYQQMITPSFFTIHAPSGYNFNNNQDVPEPVLLTTPLNRRFYTMLKYLYQKLTRFQISTTPDRINAYTEYTYAFYLDRLIYYYNLRILSPDLTPGFNKTAAIMILTHGSYYERKKSTPHNEREPLQILTFPPTFTLQNLFICNKSAIGCSSISSQYMKLNTMASTSTAGKISKGIREFGSFAFDEIFPIQEPGQPIDELGFPNCRVSRQTNPLADHLRNRIVPRTDGWANKIFSTLNINSANLSQVSSINLMRMIIDIEILDEVQSHYNIDHSYIQQIWKNINIPKTGHINPKIYIYIQPYIEILRMADLLYIMPQNFILVNKTNRGTTLNQIVSYYNSKEKTNLFVYDTSCGAIKSVDDTHGDHTLDERLPPTHPDRANLPMAISDINKYVKQIQRAALGTRRKKIKKRRHTHKRKAKKIRRHLRTRRRPPTRKRRQH